MSDSSDHHTEQCRIVIEILVNGALAPDDDLVPRAKAAILLANATALILEEHPEFREYKALGVMLAMFGFYVELIGECRTAEERFCMTKGVETTWNMLSTEEKQDFLDFESEGPFGDDAPGIETVLLAAKKTSIPNPSVN